MILEPRYPHNCGKCIFLGRHEQWDLYHCANGINETVIARKGPDGDYMSGMRFAERGTIPELVEALRRAKGWGLYSGRAV